MAELQIPRGLTITQDGDSRLYLENQVLDTYFPNFELVQDRETGRYAARGILSTAVDLYGIRVELPERYPYIMPKIKPVVWTASGPHKYPDGSLCVMKPSQWRKAYSIALMVAKAAIWVNKYEIYKRNGQREWPGNEQLHGFRALREWWDNL